MIRADLHIHTLATAWDEPFEFDLDQLRQHVLDNRLDVIAVTNHNTFDKKQYDRISGQLAGLCVVLPGVEVSALDCHTLVIVKPEEASNLVLSCDDVQNELGGNIRASMDFQSFINAFPSLDESIVIPHYSKDPAISLQNLGYLGNCVSAVEVSSLSKAIRLNKTQVLPCPAVFFTDYRFGCESSDGLRKRYKPGSVYLKAATNSFQSVRDSFSFDNLCLNSDGNDDLEFSPGVTVISGVNLILGKRSTGKTFSLDRIFSLCDEGDAYYIKQGELVDSSQEEVFYKNLDSRFASVASAYRKPWEPLIAEAVRRGTKSARREAVRHYLDDLKKHAQTSALEDSYSKCRLFNACNIDLPPEGDTDSLISATGALLSSQDHADLIDEIIGRDRLVELLKRLVAESQAVALKRLAVTEANRIVKVAKQKLAISSVELKPDPIFDSVFDDEAFFRKASALLDDCWREKRICDDGGETFSKYSVIATRKRYANARVIKDALHLGNGVSLAGMAALTSSGYIDKLLTIEDVDSLVPALFNVEIGVRDDKDAEPSGGQRTECVFLGRLAEATGSRYVLIDEPESSFDNPFLDVVIAGKIRELARNATVVVATHNQVLGLALNPNKLLLTSYDRDADRYGLAYGGLREKALTLDSGGDGPDARISVLDILEAGHESYERRKVYYEEA